jgi:exopolysaccharide biosynthesis WecB/TagA/CpsF family protein
MFTLDILDSYSDCQLDGASSFSFLNFASIGVLFNATQEDSMAFFCDGMLLSYFLSKVTGQKIVRVSFDFTSIAQQVFQRAESQQKKVYLVGARPAELDRFIDKLKKRFPALLIAGYHHGYFEEQQAKRVCAEIRDAGSDILIVGLGAGHQERFIRQARANGFTGVAFSCGGFIRQEAMTPGYFYPTWVDRYNLRAFYRMYREPHTIKRYLLDYPRNFMHLLAMLARRKVAINIVQSTPAAARMRILFVFKDFKPDGGVERVQRQLANQFCLDGQQVTFFIMNGERADTAPTDTIRQIGEPCSWGVFSVLNSALSLRRIIRQQQVTHVIAAKELANLCTRLATLGGNCRVIYTRHAALDSAEQTLNPALLAILYSFYLLGHGQVVTVSHGLKAGLTRRVPWGKTRIKHCPNAVVTEQLSAKAACPLPAHLPSNYLLAVGRLTEEKGFDLLLTAYAKALSQRPLPDLVLVGAGPEHGALHKQADQLGIAGRVHFTGFLSNPYPLIKQARFFVLSSRHEGLPTALIEALALGTPVLAADCDTGPRELLDNGRLGILVKANDVEALAEGIIQALNHSNGLRAAHLEVIKQYTSQQAAQAYYHVWNQ